MIESLQPSELSCLLIIKPSMCSNDSGDGQAADSDTKTRKERTERRPEPFMAVVARAGKDVDRRRSLRD